MTYPLMVNRFWAEAARHSTAARHNTHFFQMFINTKNVLPSCLEGVTKQLVVRKLVAKLVKMQNVDAMAPSYFFDERFFNHARLRLLVAGDMDTGSCNFACIH